MKHRTSSLIEVGDISAEPGSRQWAAALRLKLWNKLDAADTDHKGLQLFVQTAREFQAWSVLEDENGQHFPSFQAFCRHPRPQGLCVTHAMLAEWQELLRWLETGQVFTAMEKARAAYHNLSASEREQFRSWVGLDFRR